MSSGRSNGGFGHGIGGGRSSGYPSTARSGGGAYGGAPSRSQAAIRRRLRRRKLWAAGYSNGGSVWLWEQRLRKFWKRKRGRLRSFGIRRKQRVLRRLATKWIAIATHTGIRATARGGYGSTPNRGNSGDDRVARFECGELRCELGGFDARGWLRPKRRDRRIRFQSPTQRAARFRRQNDSAVISVRRPIGRHRRAQIWVARA